MTQTIESCHDFSDIIRVQGRLNSRRIFLKDIPTGRSYSFGEVDSIVERTAADLSARKVKKGEFVTAVLSNSPEYVFYYFAVLRLGAVFNPMPFSSHSQEILKNLHRVKPALTLIEEERKSEIEGAEGSFCYVPVDGNRTFERSLRPVSQSARYFSPIDADKPACLYSSSGTESDPKGVLFTHKNMVTNISSICRGFRFAPNQEVHLVFLPLGHTAAINYSLLPCAFSGGTVMLCKDFWSIRKNIWKLVESEGITYMETVPTVLYALLNIYRDGPRRGSSSLRFVGCGSAPLQKRVQVDFEKRFGVPVANLYGLSETGPTHIDYPLEKGWEPGSIGVPLDVNEVKIFGEDGKECEEGEVGEIAVKGDNVFPAYFGNRRLYSQVVRGGYFFTGDLGYRDSRGTFYFVDRKKDLIIKGGINVVPGEIDEVLLLHPAVRESVTVGIPDEMFGEDIHSFVVLFSGVQVTEKHLLEHCRGNLASYKVPRKISIVSALPRTHSGKLSRRKVRDSLNSTVAKTNGKRT